MPADAGQREVRVGVYSNEPKIFLDQDGRASGILGDVLAEIAKREDWTLKPVQCDWQTCLNALKAGEIDLLPDMAYSEERAKEFDFHKIAALHSWSAIYRNEKTHVNTTLDLQGKRIAVLEDSVQERYLRELLTGFGIRARLIPVKSLEEGFEKTAANEADVAVANRFFGDLKASRYKLHTSPVMFQPAQLFYGTNRKTNGDLLNAIDRHLEAWLSQQDSPYFKVLEKWTGQPARTVVPPWLIRGLGALAAMLLLALGVSAYLRRQVIEKTRHLQEGKEALAKSEEKLRTILDSVDAFIYLKDINGHYVFANKLVRDLWQLKMEDIIGFGDGKFFDAETAANIRRNDHRVLEAGEVQKTEETNTVSSTGKMATYLTTKLPLRGEDGRIYALCGISIDITERKRTEVELLEHKEQLRLFIEHAPAALAMFDRDMRYLAVSRRWLTDYSLGERDIIGHSHYEIFPEIPEAWKALYRRALAGEVIRNNEDRFERWDGTILWLRWEIMPWRSGNGATGGVVIFSEDVSALKEHQQQLEHIAHYDALTGLPNRVLFADRLHQAMAQTQRRGQKLAVAYLDLDGFKAINDRHGHEIGDQLLTVLAARMKQALREGDTLARLGGDEFVAVLSDLPDTEASVPMLTRLLDAAAEPVQVGILAPQVSASLGVTFYPQVEEVDADQLLRQADQAMYQAKLAGKNRYHVFDAEQDRSARGHHESLEHIRRALMEREFVLHYQPKVNMRTGEVIGAEALIRWQHPEKGLLSPIVFLPVIEDHPLAVDIGEWVIDTALAQMETWRAIGLDIPVSVNVGARQLQQADFVERLQVLLAAHPQIQPSRLELEVLETSALQDVALVSRVIDVCREIGVRFALDDFGTGYSSLTYLKRLPAEVLKIDQSFVHDMLDDPEDLAILEGVLGLATAFRRQAIAEGVETLAHGEMLLRLGCELGQGYGIARPMPANALPEWAATWRPEPRWAAATTLHPDNFPLIYAGVEHRAWISAIEATLQGDRHALPFDIHQCRFGAWLDIERQAGRDDQPHFQSIDFLHRQIHVLAAELLEYHSRGQTSAAMDRLVELHGLRDRLLAQLHALIELNNH